MQESCMDKTRYYFKQLLKLNGVKLTKFQHSHIMLMYFFAYGLDVTNSLSTQQKQLIRQYILSLQIPQGGWTSSSFYTKYQSLNNQFDLPHIVFTYSAINILSTVGGLDKINKQRCLESIRRCQKENGSYSNFSNSQQADLRFVYSAVSVCHTLGDFSRMKVQKVVEYIESCFNFDGGYGLRPSCQSHCGAIYCAIASLKMLNKRFKGANRTLNFLVNRQAFNIKAQEYIGVQGRVGKMPDSCYSFWVGASINILTNRNLINPKVQNFINLCFKQKQCSFSKYPTNECGDPLHTLHSIVGINIARNNLEDFILQKGIKKH